jgi:hypothetical protein
MNKALHSASQYREGRREGERRTILRNEEECAHLTEGFNPNAGTGSICRVSMKERKPVCPIMRLEVFCSL